MKKAIVFVVSLITILFITYNINVNGNDFPFSLQKSQQQLNHNFRPKYGKKNTISLKSNNCAQENEVLINGECQKNDTSDLTSSINISDDFTLQWGFDPEDPSIIIIFQKLNIRSWMGLGFSNKMAASDMVITEIRDDGIITIYEGLTPGHEAPTPNPDQSDIQLLGGAWSDEDILVKYIRKLKPSIKGYAQLEQNGVYEWIAAHSPADSQSDFINYHGSTNHYNFVLKLSDNFTPTSPVCDNNLVFIKGKCVKNDISSLQSSTQIDEGFNLQWEVDSKKNTVQFLIELNFKSWVSIGFGNSMTSADIIVGQIIPNNVVQIFESFSLGHERPKPNKEQYDLKLLGYQITSTSTLIKFSRYLTTDIKNTVQLQEGETYNMIAAHSLSSNPQDLLEYHDTAHYGFQITLSNNQNSQ